MFGPSKPHKVPKRLSRFYLFFCLLLFCLVVSAGCASLPDIQDLIHRHSQTQAPPEIVSARGPISPKKSRAIIKHLEKQVWPTDILGRQIALMESISGSPLVAGNKATLLIDGEATYAAMFRAIQNATDNINFEAYIFQDDEVGRRFADLLLMKQAEGIQVNLIYDSLGSKNTHPEFFRRLRDGGVRVLEFNPTNPLKVRGSLLNRDHRKILIVDGAIAFTGGVNVSAVYSRGPSGISSGGKPNELPWRDTQVQIEGPAVAEFQKLFLDTWARQNGPKLPDRNYFPVLKPQGDDLVLVVGSTSGQKNRTTYIMYVTAITFAENSVHLTNAYFVPDKQTLKAIIDAARRGVDVKMILPASSDVGLTFYAGRSYYTRLLKSGVKLYERRNAILHAKTGVIDGVWSTVGSTNMDLWSFLRNDEVNAVILGRDFAARMEEMFATDLEQSTEIHLEQWKKRPFGERAREFLTHLLALTRWL